MKTKAFIAISTLIASSGAFAIEDKVIASLENRQFKIECESEYSGKFTWANEPAQSHYFLFGPNARMVNKGVMDLGAYDKVSLKYVGKEGFPQWNKYKLDFSVPTYGSEDKRIYAVYYFTDENKVLSHAVTLSSDGKQVKGVHTERFYNCMTLGL